ncbi:MAG: hypothetical protein GXY76_23335 [Chloroflexi bacterium]|nr:hypothetical protein [Chloroflexota bacterium]
MAGPKTTEKPARGGPVRGSAAQRQQDEQTTQVIAGIRALSRAVLDDTKSEAEQRVALALEAARNLRREAELQAQQIAAETLAEAEMEAAHLRQRRLANARLEAQRVLLTRREELIDEVFTRARERLGELRQAPDYKQVVLALVRDGVAKLGEPPEATVRLSASDAGLLTEADLAALAADWRGRVKLSLGTAAEISGGAVIEAGGGHREYDNSFEHRLAELRAALRAEVYQLLQGAA